MALREGFPTVQPIAEALHISPNYLSDMLRIATGKSAQGHIQDKIIEKAKELLSTTNLSISEVAYLVGFERPQSLNCLFKKKTNLTPVAFKQGLGSN